jgi:hypothetical protein
MLLCLDRVRMNSKFMIPTLADFMAGLVTSPE